MPQRLYRLPALWHVVYGWASIRTIVRSISIEKLVQRNPQKLSTQRSFTPFS
jgi:hypothetical protein